MTEGLNDSELSTPPITAQTAGPALQEGRSAASEPPKELPPDMLANPVAKAVAEALSQGLASPWQRSVNDVLQQMIDLIRRHSLSLRQEINEYQRIINILQGSGQLAVNAAIDAQRDLPRIVVPNMVAAPDSTR